jgi:hypothetical protein
VKIIEYAAPPRDTPGADTQLQVPEATPTVPPTVTPAASPTVPPAVSPTSDLSPSVEIIGPDTVVFRERTHFTFISRNARGAEWSIGGFENNEVFVVTPLAPSHQIFVEVTDERRIGDSFIIAVTVYGENGRTASATKQFTVIDR